jgi:hypothetical protein
VVGTLSDSGSATTIPTGVLNMGRAKGTHAACGTPPCGPYTVILMTPDALGAAGTGIVANPSVNQTIQPSTDVTGLIVKQSNTTNTADVFDVEDKSANKLLDIDSAGNVHIKQLQAGGTYLYAAEFAGATADIKINACLTALPSAGGTCDATGLGATPTIAATITFPSSEPAVLFLACGQQYSVTITNSTPAINMSSKSALVSDCYGTNQASVIMGSSAHVNAMLECYSLTTACYHTTVRGIELAQDALGKVDNAILDAPNWYDSTFEDLSLSYGKGKMLWVHTVSGSVQSNSLYCYGTTVDCVNTAGCQPVVISGSGANGAANGIHFFGGDWGHPGTGQYLLSIDGGTTFGLQGITFHGMYFEGNTSGDTTTDLIHITDAINVGFFGLHSTFLQASSAAVGVHILQSGASNTEGISLHNYSQTGSTGNAVTTTVTGCTNLGIQTNALGPNLTTIPEYQCMSSYATRASRSIIGQLYLDGNTIGTATNCAAAGTAASPSVASCASAVAGHFSCATNATGATCTVNTTAVTANSEIFVFESDTAVTGTALGVTCNTGTNVLPTSRLLASSVAATSFTINLGTVTTNPACFSYQIVN